MSLFVLEHSDNELSDTPNESQPLESSTIPSTPSTPRIPSLKRKRDTKRDHQLWAHHRLPFPHEPEKRNNRTIFYCKHCLDIPFQSQSNTSTRNHLRKHKIFLNTIQESDTYTNAASSSSSKQLSIQHSFSNAPQHNNNKSLREHINQDAFQSTLISFITQHNLPSTLVQWPEFRQLMGLTNPFILENIPKSHTTMSRLIESQFDTQQQIIITHLHNAKSLVHFTTDT